MRDDWLSTTLRDIAEEDGRQGDAAIEKTLAAASRARPVRTTRASFAIGLTLIATLAAGLGIGFWQILRAQHDARTMPHSRIEVATGFVPLTYSAVPATDIQIVRLALPRSSLVAARLLPVDAVGPDPTALVWADVLVGEDGLARAIRFVRIAGAQSN